MGMLGLEEKWVRKREGNTKGEPEGKLHFHVAFQFLPLFPRE